MVYAFPMETTPIQQRNAHYITVAMFSRVWRVITALTHRANRAEHENCSNTWQSVLSVWGRREKSPPPFPSNECMLAHSSRAEMEGGSALNSHSGGGTVGTSNSATMRDFGGACNTQEQHSNYQTSFNISWKLHITMNNYPPTPRVWNLH